MKLLQYNESQKQFLNLNIVNYRKKKCAGLTQISSWVHIGANTVPDSGAFSVLQAHKTEYTLVI